MNNLRKIGSIIKSYTKGITPKYVNESSIIVLNQKCIRKNRIDLNFAQFTDDKIIYPEKKYLKIGDILINSTGQGTAGRVSIVNTIPENKKLIVDSHILILRCENIFEARCLNYSLYSIEKLLQTFIDGSTGQGEFDKIRLFNLSVNYSRDTFEQRKIASVLSAIDLKIEINDKINSELEAKAKILYDYWFLQFDFPNENGKPYKSSGGKMVYNEDIKRFIPYDWEVNPLFEEMDVQYGFAFDTSKFTDDNTQKPVVRIRDILENTISTYSTEEVNVKYMLSRKDLIIGMDGNFHLNFWDKNGAYLNQRSVRIKSKQDSEVSNFQAYFELAPYIKAREKNVSRTTVAHLSDKDLKRMFLVSAKTNINFNPKITFDSFLDKIILNRIQNQKLSELRNWLLPILMNGQVTVTSDININKDEVLAMVAEPTPIYEREAIELVPNKMSSAQKAILAGHIINLNLSEDFGRVKLQKLLFLVEYDCKIDLDSNYVQRTAGPHDQNLLDEVEGQLIRYNFFNIHQEKGTNKRVHYKPLSASQELETLFTEHFASVSHKVNDLLAKLKHSTWEQCEIVATLFAVWNNRLIKNESTDPESLKSDFLKWDAKKKKYKDRLDEELVWMRNNNIVPDGWGKLIEKPIKKM